MMTETPPVPRQTKVAPALAGEGTVCTPPHKGLGIAWCIPGAEGTAGLCSGLANGEENGLGNGLGCADEPLDEPSLWRRRV